MGVSAHAVTLGPPVLLWAACAYKFPAALRGRDDPALSAHYASLGWLAVAMTLLVPEFTGALDALAGVPNLAWLLMYATTLLSGFSATIALLHEEHPQAVARRRARRRRWAMAVLIGVLVGLFVLAGPQAESQDFVADHGRHPAIAVFLTTFYAGLAFVCLDMIPACWRAANAGNGLLRLGLRGTAVAGVLTLGFLAYNETAVALLVTGHPAALVGDPMAISRVLLVPITALIAVGTTIPDWGARLRVGELPAWFWQYRTRRRLFRLWYDLCSCVPTLSLQRRSEPVGGRAVAVARDVFSLRDAGFHLHRRVIEITDGFLALRGFQDPVSAAALLARLPAARDHRQRRAAAEAAGVLASITAKLAGRPTPTGAVPTSTVAPAFEAWDLDEEVAQLTRIAVAYRRLAPARPVRRRPLPAELMTAPTGSAAREPSHRPPAARKT